MDRVLTLHFIDGTKLSFEFSQQTASTAGRQFKIADFMTSRHLLVEAEGQVMIFPVTSIKYMALSIPSLGKAAASLPKHAIVGARIRS